MTEPTDTDRIIAAHRDEARKTRALLLCIFVGIPVIAGIVWAIFAVISADNARSRNNAALSPEIDITTTADDYVAPAGGVGIVSSPTPTIPPATQQLVVTKATMCSAISDWLGRNGTAGPINPHDAAIYNGYAKWPDVDPIINYLTGSGVDPSTATVDRSFIVTNCRGHDGTTKGLPDETVVAALNQR